MRIGADPLSSPLPELPELATPPLAASLPAALGMPPSSARLWSPERPPSAPSLAADPHATTSRAPRNHQSPAFIAFSELVWVSS